MGMAITRRRWPYMLLCVAVVGTACGETPEDPDALRTALPEVPYCDVARDWPASWEQVEQRTIDRIDRLRWRGADCDERGYAPMAPALRFDGALSCAARVHAIAMSEQGQVGHTTPDGTDLAMRIEAVGYQGRATELLAAGPMTAEEALDGVWRPSSFHCDQLMSPPHVDIGIAFVGATKPGDAYESYWVAVMGDPPGNPLAP